MSRLVVILDNIRSIYNVGSIFRSADGAGVSKIYCVGITPYPRMQIDSRPPWEVETVHRRLQKTALGAEESVESEWCEDVSKVISRLKSNGFLIISLETNEQSTNIFETDFSKSTKQALILGNEIGGVSREALNMSDRVVHIPMRGAKKSLNVSSAGAIAMYEICNKVTDLLS